MIRGLFRICLNASTHKRILPILNRVLKIGVVSSFSYAGYLHLKSDLKHPLSKGVLLKSVNAATDKPPISPLYTLADIVEEISPAVVSICIRYYIGTSLGSGFIISPDGYLLTAAHVIGNESQANVTLMDGREYVATVLAFDSESDLALLKIRNVENKALPHLKFADISRARAGEFVLALGSPVGLSNTVTMGVISNVSQDIGRRINLKYLQTDAAITKGNSGGPLVNIKGEVVGVNVMTLTQGFSFAVPIDHAERFISTAMKRLDTSSPKADYRPGVYIGLSMVTMTSEMLHYMHQRNMFSSIRNGVFIKQVADGSPAQKGGLMSGDVIVEIDGKPISNTDDVYKNVLNKSEIHFTIFRNGQIIKIGPIKP